MEPRILAHIDKFCTYISDHKGHNVDVDKDGPQGHNMAVKAWHLVFDITSDLCFGQSFDLVGSEKERYLYEYIGGLLKREYVVSPASLLP